MIYFLHIQKTGGGSIETQMHKIAASTGGVLLNWSRSWYYGHSLEKMQHTLKHASQRLVLVHHHGPQPTLFELRNDILDLRDELKGSECPVLIFTLLRPPQEMFLSWMNWGKKKNLYNLIPNPQVNTLIHRLTDGDHYTPSQKFWTRKNSSEDFALACEVIGLFDHVGFTNDIEDTFHVLEAVSGVSLPYVHGHKTEKTRLLSEKDVDYIANTSLLDFRLYEKARQEFRPGLYLQKLRNGQTGLDSKMLELNKDRQEKSVGFMIEDIFVDSQFKGQRGQDRWLYEYVFKHIGSASGTQYNRLKDGVFVEFGARDGILNSKTYFYEKALNWSGVLVEPGKTDFQKLRQNRECHYRKKKACFHAAIYSGANATFSHKDRAVGGRDRHAFLGYVKGNGMKKVRSMTLNGILHFLDIGEVDYLSADCEGCEWEALRKFRVDIHRPRIIMIERENNEKIIDHFRKQGYALLRRKGEDIMFGGPLQALDEYLLRRDLLSLVPTDICVDYLLLPPHQTIYSDLTT